MNDRFKFRVWNKLTHSFTTGGAIKFGGLCFVDEEDFGIKLGEHQECYIIEQCTGLKDKNGNLIYEGDIVDCELQNIDSHGYPFIHFKKGVVKRAKNGAYCVEGDDDFYASDITLYPIEIIGNIHEQAE